MADPKVPQDGDGPSWVEPSVTDNEVTTEEEDEGQQGHRDAKETYLKETGATPTAFDFDRPHRPY